MTELIESKKPEWQDLTTEQKNAVIALSLSRSTNQASALFKTMTKRSRAYFYANVYPTVKDIWREMNTMAPDEALSVLRGGSIAAARELIDQIGDEDVRIRNKAANDVLDRVVAKSTESMGVSVKDGDKEIRFVLTRGQ